MIETLRRQAMPVDAELADLKDARAELRAQARMGTEEKASEETLDPRVLSSVLISLKLSQTQDEAQPVDDPHSRLLELMHSGPVKALLDTAALFARREGIAPHVALQQVVSSMQEIDKLWNLVLMKEGLSRLSSQYH